MCNREISSRRIDWFFPRSSTTIRGRSPGVGVAPTPPPPARAKVAKHRVRARVKGQLLVGTTLRVRLPQHGNHGVLWALFCVVFQTCVNILRNLNVLRVSMKEKSPTCLFNSTQGAKEGGVDPMKRGLFVLYSGSWICWRLLIAGSFEFIGRQYVKTFYPK